MPFPLFWGWDVRFGRRAEIEGARYLRSLGYRILASPFRVRSGEIDIVADDDGCLVFVEVKARRGDPHPEDAVGGRKKRRIIAAARAYRSRYRDNPRPYRFDILAVRRPEGEEPIYRLIRDAFREHLNRRF